MAFEDKDYNLTVYLGLIITSAIMFWWWYNNLETGTFFFTLFLFSGLMIPFISLFTKETSNKTVFKGISFPFTTSIGGASATFLLSFFGFLGLNWLFNIVTRGSFTVTNIWQPLTASETTTLIQQQTAAQLSIITSKGVQLFTTIFAAPFIEEFSFGFVFQYAAMVAVFFLIVAIFKTKNPNKNIVIISGAIIVSVIFAFLHTLNSTYGTFILSDLSTWQPYLTAAGFRLFLNLGIYYFLPVLTGAIGLHMANNLWWYATNPTYGVGWVETISTLVNSALGWLFVSFIILNIIIAINYNKDANTFFKTLVRSFSKNVLR